MRTTDEDPILFIRDALRGHQSLLAADVGCGEGRYDRMLFRHLPGLHLICVDVNEDMLAQLGSHLTGDGITGFETRLSAIEDLDLRENSLQAMFSFNSVHHFDLHIFLSKAAQALGPGGRLFVYSRTPEQNALTIWGRFFPRFNEIETRLYPEKTMRDIIESTQGLGLIETKTFLFKRSATLRQLMDRAHARHYSTFSLYARDEFDASCRAFRRNVEERFEDLENVSWDDRNVMYHVESR